MSRPVELLGEVTGDWQERLGLVVETMREMSRQTDPQVMAQAYRARMRRLLPIDNSVSLSRRDLAWPRVRITRSTLWKEDINPWKERDRLPVLEGGLLAQLIYSDEPRLFDNLEVPADDPGAVHLAGHRSMLAVPLYDQGVALNMVLLLRRERAAFAPEQFPQIVWMSNLFGRVTHNLLLSDQIKEAFQTVDHEMTAIADIQRSLLPARLPAIPTLALATYYQMSERAGGDYYDIFPLPDGRWGLLIADVSGHGAPAAVLMAVTHSLAHTYPGNHLPPGQLLGHINRHLSTLYTAQSDTFVTAFYGVYDPRDRSLVYSSAGHNPPRLKRCADGTLALLDSARSLPLGVFPNETYGVASHQLVPGDQLVLYTDGITEAQNPAGQMFGLERLDRVLENCAIGAQDLLKEVLATLDQFTAGRPPHDDRTLLVGKVS
jgi:sigma-B regulation protein RsbU (phosphoserine phosphatase)